LCFVEFKGKVRLPVIGLFAKSHMDYEIDRVRENPQTQPSLSEMTQKVGIPSLSVAQSQNKTIG
jgi:alkaline phosphatase